MTVEDRAEAERRAMARARALGESVLGRGGAHAGRAAAARSRRAAMARAGSSAP